MKKVGKITLPFLVMLLAFGLCHYLGAFDLLHLDTLKQMHIDIREYVSIHPILSIFFYIVLYIMFSLSAMPGLFAFDVVGGFFLPQPFITIAIALGGMMGATALYLTIKYALREFFQNRFATFIEKVQKKFDQNPYSYLLFLRFFPFFPFGLVNIALAFLGIRTRTFMWTTFIGLLPAAYIYSEAGRGLGLIFQSDIPFAFENLCSYPMLISLVGIGALALIPVFLKKKVSFD